MASEAEIERLYQQFVAGGGGSLTFDGTNLTPKQYSDATTASKLSPLQLAQLESKQHQFNKQSALGSIADEIDANNFTNPYVARGAYTTSLFNDLSGTDNTAPVYNQVSEIGDISSALSGFSTVDKAAIFAGVLAASGVDLDKILKIGGLMVLGTAMSSSLTNHTNNQTANIPQTMADASSLASMNAQFGEAGNPCDQFNNLMGLLGGVFDGTLDFIDGAVGAIIGFLKQTGILSLLTAIKDAILGVVGGVLAVVTAIVGVVVGAAVAIIQKLAPIVGKIINAIADIVSQIASEIAGFIDMAAALLRKALALVLGGAALDPCQAAVLMNTGSPAMKDAVTLLNHPMGTGHPSAIGTSVDARADESNVRSTMTSAYEQAEISPGVPQSPFTESAKIYKPIDETLHPKTGLSEDSPKAEYGTDRYKHIEEVTSRHYRDAIDEWKGRQVAFKRDCQALTLEMTKAMRVKQFPAIVGTDRGVMYRVIQMRKEVKDIMYTVLGIPGSQIPYTYKSYNGIIDDEKEAGILINYNKNLKPRWTRRYASALAKLDLIKTEWNSIDSQLY
jgi:hypothetical protein